MKNISPLAIICLFSLVFLFSCSDEEACKESAWYADNDADGFGDSSNTKMACGTFLILPGRNLYYSLKLFEKYDRLVKPVRYITSVMLPS